MKIRPTLIIFFLSALAGASALRADTPPAAVAVSPRELTIVVVEQLGRNPDRIGEFDRLDIAFTKVFKKRKWPLAIKVERFGANEQANENELRIYLKGIYPEAHDDMTFHGWMTFTGPAGKTDFGMVTFRYYPRAAEPIEDVIDKVMRGAAEIAADKIEPLLFPGDGHPKH